MLSLTGYNIMLKSLIEQTVQLAESCILAAHDLTGDKRDLLLSISAEEAESAEELKNIFTKLFDQAPEPEYNIKDADINELIRLTADRAALFSHIATYAPSKELMLIYKDLAQKATKHGYMLLLIL